MISESLKPEERFSRSLHPGTIHRAAERNVRFDRPFGFGGCIKHNRFEPADDGLRRRRQRCQTKVCKASAFERGGLFHQFLGLCVHAETETRVRRFSRFVRLKFEVYLFLWPSLLAQMYVQWDNETSQRQLGSWINRSDLPP